MLLVLGFFTCGFQLAFITVHLPAYLKDAGLSAAIGGWTLAVIGLANAFGSLGSGWLSSRMSKRWLLAWIYLGRSFAIAVFIVIPASPVTAIAVRHLHRAAVAVDRAADLLARNADVRHPLHGDALRLRLLLAPGRRLFRGLARRALYEMFGNYNMVWWLSVVLGLASALINLPIVEQPVQRPAVPMPAE